MSAPTAARKEAEARLVEARALIGPAGPRQALVKVKEALEADPGYADAYPFAALLLNELKEPEAALELFEHGRTAAEQEASFYRWWGDFLAQQGTYEQAHWRFEQAIALDEKDVEAHLADGAVLLTLDLAVEAAARFERVASELDPRSGAAFSGWGRACMGTMEFELALLKFEKAIELDHRSPALIDHLLDASDALFELKRFREAREASENAIRCEDEFNASPLQRYRSRHNAAVALLELHEAKEALAYCEAGLERLAGAGWSARSAEASLHYVAGVARVTLKMYGDGIASFRRSAAISDLFAVHTTSAIASTLAMQGMYPESWNELRRLDESYRLVEATADGGPDDEQRLAYGRGLLWLERFDEAEALFKSALGPAQKKAGAWARLMVLYLERRDQEVEKAHYWQWQAYEAFRHAVPLLEDHCKENESFAGAVTALGQLHMLIGEFDKAETLLEKAARLDSQSMDPFAALGTVRAQRGQYAGAVEQFELALKRQPDDLVVRCYLADAYFRLGRRDVALDTYEEVLRLAPGNVGANIGAGEALVEQAEEAEDDVLYEEAAKRFSKAIELAKSVGFGAANQRGSSGLGARQWTDLYYSRGYVWARLYEAEMKDRIGRLPSKDAGGYLECALRDFEAATNTGVDSHRAKRAAASVRSRLKGFTVRTLAENIAPWTIAAVSFVLLVLVQVAFLSEGGFSGGKSTAAYASLTLSLVVLMVAGFYLPQVLKLKLGGIQLEKATTEMGEGSLNVHRQPFRSSIHATLEPTVPSSSRVERAPAQRAGQVHSPLAPPPSGSSAWQR